jgi:hypothetical protein
MDFPSGAALFSLKLIPTGISNPNFNKNAEAMVQLRHFFLKIGKQRMPPRLKLEGQKFGRLTVVEFAHNNKHHNAMFHCVCDCGGNAIVRSRDPTPKRGFRLSVFLTEENSKRGSDEKKTEKRETEFTV